tara:strand:+ start:314 stop:1327 length:1014 start_codon:yes stop_codon:yes gene_type:complete
MNAKKIDILNIALVIMSLFIAIKLPFELFLFSYAFLGPLHYLTEINWLHKKKYFSKANNKWTFVLVILSVLISIFPLIRFLNVGFNETTLNFFKSISRYSSTLHLTGFLFAISLIFLKKINEMIITLMLIILISIISVKYLPNIIVLIGMFLPTLVHVYVFTLLFILYGALKSKSKYGLILSLMLLVIPVLIYFIPVDYINYKLSNSTKQAFIGSNMRAIILKIAGFFNELQQGSFNFLSETVIRIQIFISFAYTYHYLNWFSKTSIIGWKEAINKKNAFLIVFLWILSCSLYIYDFRTGFVALFFLSVLHVFLEFPLNVFSMKGLFSLAKERNNKQ